ncbi:MAG: urea carboxylase [Cellvibrionaceae bacterium]|nr:urea carboxylase [Cellvibrionaceae bacterium]|tara:strand:- start:13412 stop:14143 length:732 start_codon:yes stop_codon:yes gene_type:complete
MKNYIEHIDYHTEIPANSHWSVRVRRGSCMRLTDLSGNGNLAMLFYNPENLLERYNAPDTLKCQHTFKLTAGHCLYSDMGRIFASVVADSCGWHETVCGNSHAQHVEQRWGARDYQNHHNDWQQNGNDAFLTELAKYGLSRVDMAANVNWFSKVTSDDQGNLQLADNNSLAGSQVLLRFEMDTLVLMHSCPHPLNPSHNYPRHPIAVELGTAQALKEDDLCRNSCDENRRGFDNNRLYHIGCI